MTVTVTIDHTYTYTPDGSNIRVAIKRALELHDAAAREAKKQGKLVPKSTADRARTTGLSIRVTAEIERTPKSAAPSPSLDAEDPAPPLAGSYQRPAKKKKPRRVKRGPILT